MENIFKVIVVVFLVISLSGCIASTEEQKSSNEKLQAVIPCTDDRPLYCTKEMAPACGVLRDRSTRDYNSGCMACTRRVVIGYIPGRCK